MEVELEGTAALRFADGSPVRAASAIVRVDTGWLVAQDDATHAAWLPGDAVRGRDAVCSTVPVRLLPAVEGIERFDEASGTKQLKPDLECGVEVVVNGLPGAMFLGSGSSPLRMRGSLVRLVDGTWRHRSVDLGLLYAAVVSALGIDPASLNLEGACVVGDSLRWFQRGRPAAGVPTSSVDVPLPELLAAVAGDARAARLQSVRVYDLGSVGGVGLAVTDAVALGDGLVLASCAAEDSPNPRDDGPVVGTALALLQGAEVRSVAPLPLIDGRVAKVEGLAQLERAERSARVLATVDADDPESPSPLVRLHVRW